MVLLIIWAPIVQNGSFNCLGPYSKRPHFLLKLLLKLKHSGTSPARTRQCFQRAERKHRWLDCVFGFYDFGISAVLGFRDLGLQLPEP